MQSKIQLKMKNIIVLWNIIISLNLPSSFGKDDQTVYDESVRKGYHIEGTRVKVPYFDNSNWGYIPEDHYLRDSPFQLKLTLDFSSDDIANLKIAMVSPKTINEPSRLIKYEDKETLMFCGNKYSNLYSIYSKPLPSTGNEERKHEWTITVVQDHL
ncbi:hypothetical protein DICPUDRAFT_151180 [Dictyostelium purpureum]|uniref:Uncharacterized protein n=1 Tax=Dictyostelium purpureum TaxID=5786 RepID=F0ZI69_DICPU|nr:uncharacterized protein DICPUDRAFT_151180 [Dictyostelium purpureum]EGC36353.1 hypothetical protein DICPUDRAFT_151180 [Dictyostelium purpureum]|eukprot:XP_003287107.1 hypothetical protein DICPUDRAFT_151180 [Dictyostelium purpureum]